MPADSLLRPPRVDPLTVSLDAANGEFTDTVAETDDLILITGSAGFIGINVVENLLARGFCRLRCLVRSSSNTQPLRKIIDRFASASAVEIMQGNLLSKEDCADAADEAAVIYHLAAGRGEKSFADAFMNTVVTTRNLLDASLASKSLKRFVNVSSFAVYSHPRNNRSKVLDESCPVEQRPHLRGEAYCFAKVRQEELVINYGKKQGIPYVIVRPGYVYGPGNEGITGRVGIDTFGIFLHLGGSNIVPLSYVENCADAIVLAGLKKGIEGEVFNAIDDDLPSSRQFLRLYKRKVRRFGSLYVPHFATYLLCLLWEKYSDWSEGQLPPVFNRKRWWAEWKKCRYSNTKLKQRLNWKPKVLTADGLKRHFESCRKKLRNA